MPDETTRALSALGGAVAGIWGAAVDAYPETGRGRWAARVIGWLLVSAVTGYGGSLALSTATVPAGLPDLVAAGLRWVLSWPFWLHAISIGAVAHVLVPAVIAAVKRRLGSL